MEKQFEKRILEKLLHKYEKSKISKEGSKRNLSICFLFDEKNMPEYVDENSYQYESFIEGAANHLKEIGLIDIFYDSDGRIKKVSLVLDQVEESYQFLNKKSLQENREEIGSVLNKYQNRGELVSWYVSKIKERLSHYKSTISIFKTVEDLEEILFVLERLEKQKEEISIRNFSAKYLKNSKRFEMILSKVERIVSEYLGRQEEEILSTYNVYKNPTFVYLKGNGKFKIHNQIIDLAALQSEMILSSYHLEVLGVLSLDCKEIVTVENLTTFYGYPCTNRCVIYLGGFHNSIRKKLLCMLHDFDNSISFYHVGDIDVGGFYILNHLIADTKIPFRARKMDIDTLAQYKDYVCDLTTEDRKRLKDLKGIEALKEYEDIFDYMLENNMKLEQENIYYD